MVGLLDLVFIQHNSDWIAWFYNKLAHDKKCKPFPSMPQTKVTKKKKKKKPNLNAGLCISPPSLLVLSMRRDEMCFSTIIVQHPSEQLDEKASNKCSKTAWILSEGQQSFI